MFVAGIIRLGFDPTCDLLMSTKSAHQEFLTQMLIYTPTQNVQIYLGLLVL